MASIIQVRRDTAANWALVNPILAQGEQGYEIDTGKLKFGNGSSAWNSLPYFNTGSGGAYLHTQSIAAAIWNINHNLGYKPGGILAFDSANEQWIGSITYVDDNNITLDFGTAVFSGKAYIS